ncbi:hypothetical protein C8J57DRAFT_1530187 [Mycena rebaudengoi]|nr:hypothetical protein C8J57DRAFT_1530187 [Mycena rebaudengoi]
MAVFTLGALGMGLPCYDDQEGTNWVGGNLNSTTSLDWAGRHSLIKLRGSSGTSASANSSNSTTTDDVLFIWGQSICRMTLSHGVGWLFYGIYFATFFSYIFRPHHTRQFTANRILQAAMFTLFFSSTLRFVTDFVFSIAQVQGYLMSTTFPLPERKDAWQNTHLPFYVL